MSVAKGEPKTKATTVERRRLGRPTKEEAQHLTEQIIDVATPLFLKNGYEATSVDSIVAAALISKQTFYARFVSKETLFSAVIRRRVNDLLLPVVRDPLEAGTIDTILVRIGVELTKRSLTPTAIAIDRLIASEAHQFPQLALVYHENSDHVTDLIAEIFGKAMKDGEIRQSAHSARFLAEQFRYAVIDGPARALVLSSKKTRSEKEWHERLVAAVDLFLRGCRA